MRGASARVLAWQLARLGRVIASLIDQRRHGDAGRMWVIAQQLALAGIADAAFRSGWTAGKSFEAARPR